MIISQQILKFNTAGSNKKTHFKMGNISKRWLQFSTNLHVHEFSILVWQIKCITILEQLEIIVYLKSIMTVIHVCDFCCNKIQYNPSRATPFGRQRFWLLERGIALEGGKFIVNHFFGIK
jgi:hypothetical protein